MFEWSDLRFFLAVARAGSTLAASKQLRVSQATVSRRLAVLEDALGIELFVRSPAGYALTSRGEVLLPLAEEIEQAADRFVNAAGAEVRRLSGQVRLTTVESAVNVWVIPAIAEFRTQHPEVQVEVIATDEPLDLIRGEADIGLRFGPRPQEEVLIARHLIELEECLYASRELVTRLGRPASLAEVSRYPFVTDSLGRAGRFTDWIEANVSAAQVVHRVNSLSGVAASVRAGIGAALLPCIMGDRQRNLVRLMPPIAELATSCWLVTTDQARRQPHIRAVIDHVVAYVGKVARESGEGDRTALSA